MDLARMPLARRLGAALGGILASCTPASDTEAVHTPPGRTQPHSGAGAHIASRPNDAGPTRDAGVDASVVDGSPGSRDAGADSEGKPDAAADADVEAPGRVGSPCTPGDAGSDGVLVNCF